MPVRLASGGDERAGGAPCGRRVAHRRAARDQDGGGGKRTGGAERLAAGVELDAARCAEIEGRLLSLDVNNYMGRQ